MIKYHMNFLSEFSPRKIHPQQMDTEKRIPLRLIRPQKI